MISLQEVIQNESAYPDAVKQAIRQDIRCAMPGIVREYFINTQTATIQLAVRDARGAGAYEELPLLMDVPVFFPGGSKARIMYEVLPGDECLVIFADTCIDAWYQYGQIANPLIPRRHDLSDGFAIVGFSSRPNVLPSDDNALSLRVNVGGDWKTPFAIDRDGNVLVNGHVI